MAKKIQWKKKTRKKRQYDLDYSTVIKKNAAEAMVSLETKKKH